jgi:hypothetical protein
MVLALDADDARSKERPPSECLELHKPWPTMAPKQHQQRHPALDLLAGARVDLDLAIHCKIPI